MKILRWILFFPLSWMGAGLLCYTNSKLFQPLPWIDFLMKPMLFALAFFYIARYIIPSTTETKNRLPLILIVIINFISLLLFFLSFYLIYTNEIEFKIKYLSNFIGVLITLFGCIYILCSPKFLKELEDETEQQKGQHIIHE